jgi:WD40 repeat protein
MIGIFNNTIERSFVVKKTTHDQSVPVCMIGYSDYIFIGLRVPYDGQSNGPQNALPFKTFDTTDTNSHRLKNHYDHKQGGLLSRCSVISARMSPCGQIIMVLGSNHIISWDPLLQCIDKILYDSKNEDQPLGQIDFLHNETQWLIACCSGKTVKIINPLDNEVVDTLDHMDTVKCLSVTSWNRIITGSSDGTLRVWDRDPGTNKNFWPSLRSKLFSLTKSKKSTEIRSEWKCTKIIDHHKETIRCIESLSDTKFVSASDDGTIRTWVYDSMGKRYLCANMFILPKSEYMHDIAVTQCGQTLSLSSGILRTWDPVTGRSRILNLRSYQDQDEYMMIQCIAKHKHCDKIIAMCCDDGTMSYKILIFG